MDFEIVFWLVLLLAPLLSRLLRKRQSGQRPTQPRPLPSSGERAERELTPFEEALRQIQEALTDGARVPAPREEPKPTPIRARVEKAPEEFHARTEAAERPRFYDDKFESAAPYTSPGAKEHYHEPLGTDPDPPTEKPRRRRKATKWQKAIVNLVLLDEPRSRSPWTPRDR